ncbi:hypothetical protein ODS41_13425 [Pyrobaculum sp. 3827-6]|uniref:hypothetical protein n=1 Tax=Pyrobaculum sp. 3827-6 TaxID=2983604 RepID=UPI0021D9631D|nr:hypothetical protein [Pyrobaculum sp. 3827-6]MCU7788912.1 hypothetical protein [Pyrobaculum sp. 3827-6]
MMAVYGGCVEHPQVVCVKSREELLSHVGRSFLVVVGDEALARELEAAFFTEEEWREFVKFFRQFVEGGRGGD